MSAATSRLGKSLVWGTIAANLAVFVRWHIVPHPKSVPNDPNNPQYQHYKAIQQKYMYENYTISRHNLSEGRYHTLLTAAFSHTNITHLGINMYIFKQSADVALALGISPARLAALSLGSALSGSAGSLLGRDKQDIPGLGASGMVQGMLVATMLAAPKLPVNVMFIPIDISYRTVVLGFIAYDLYNFIAEQRAGKKLQTDSWLLGTTYVGYAAHLGGAAFGAAFYFFLARRRGRVPPGMVGGLRRPSPQSPVSGAQTQAPWRSEMPGSQPPPGSKPPSGNQLPDPPSVQQPQETKRPYRPIPKILNKKK